jgi:predicted transcriptional regulator
MRKQLAITERQFEVLSLLWDHGPMTVRELLDRLPREQPLPYTTVLGLLQVMEKAGLLTHDAENQTHRYRPVMSQQQATSKLLTDFVQRFFRGSAERLVLGLVDAKKLSAEDLRELESRLLADDSAQKTSNKSISKNAPSKSTRRKS